MKWHQKEKYEEVRVKIGEIRIMEIRANGATSSVDLSLTLSSSTHSSRLEKKMILREAIRIYGRHFGAENADFLDHPLFLAFVGRFKGFFDLMIFPMISMLRLSKI